MEHTDVQALGLLHKQLMALKQIPNTTSPNVPFAQYEALVRRTVSSTQKDIEIVSEYTKQILEELEKVRKRVNSCCIKLGEQMQEMMKNIHVENENKDIHVQTSKKDTKKSAEQNQRIKLPPLLNEKKFNKNPNHAMSKELEIEKLKQIRLLQNLAKQQQELMTMIAATEGLILKIESNAVISRSEVSELSDKINQWCDCLETAEEKKRRKKAEVDNEKQDKRKEAAELRLETLKKREAEENKLKHAERDKRNKREKEQEAEKNKQKLAETEQKENRKREELERQQKEQEKRDADEKRKKQTEKEEKEKRKQEERERKQKEQEKQEAEEKKRKQEEEEKQRDWKNWPQFIYYNTKPNKFQQKICCVVLAMPYAIKQDGLICTATDSENDLDTCLETNDEQIISSLITIRSKLKNMVFKAGTPKSSANVAERFPFDILKVASPETFNVVLWAVLMPIRVYVPVISYDEPLVSYLKYSINGKKWMIGKSLPEITIPDVTDITFIGAEIPITRFEGIQCVAMAGHNRYEIEIDENGKTYEPEVDRNIKLKFPPKAFLGKTIVTTKAVTLTHQTIENAAKKHKELQNTKIAGSYIDISCENSVTEDSELEVYDFGWVVDKNGQKNQSVNQETISRSTRWLVNNMNPDTNVLSDAFDSDFFADLETKETKGDKTRHILNKLRECKDSDFEKFVVSIKSTQPEVASRIMDVKSLVKKHHSSKGEDTASESNFASDFDPDFEKKEGTVRIVHKVTGKSWEVAPIHVLKDQRGRFLKLPSGNNKFQVLGLVVPELMADEDICRAAELLEDCLDGVTNVSVICRQNHANLHDVVIEVVKSNDVRDTLEQLGSLGYSSGPPESTEFGVIDGEEIEIKIEPNLYLEEQQSSLTFKFYNNLPLRRYSGHLAVVKRNDQDEDDKYNGYLTYCVAAGRIPVKRTGSLVLYVPKPVEDMIGNFPYTLDVQVKALAKFIAWQLTKDNFNSTRWVKHAGYLTNGDKQIYHQIVQYVDKERKGAPQRDRCEVFILYWANHQVQDDTDKVEKIITSHHDHPLESEARQFIKPYIHGKGLLSNDNLEKMALTLASDWQVMATKLGFSNDDVNKITDTYAGKLKQALRMLDMWRLSDSAIQKGTDLIKSLHETAKSAQCGAKLLSIISNYV